MTYEEIVQALRESTRELNHEGIAVRAGHKQEQNTAAIMEKYAWLFSDEALQTVEAYEPRGEHERESQRRVRAALMQGLIERSVAAQEDRLTTFYASTSAEVDGEKIPFFTAWTQMTLDPDPRRREALATGCAEVMADADELALEVTAKTQDVIRGFGYASYVPFWADLKEVDYAPLADELERVAQTLMDAYRGAVEPWMRSAGHEYGSCPYAHFSYFRGMPHHRPLFTPERFQGVMEKTFDGIGLDLFSEKTIHLDLDDRPSKNPRASVWVPEAGVEVHLLTRPTGGHSDYASFLHESGHALHFGLTDPEIGWPLANLGRSMAYAEVWSYLFEHIGFQPAWLQAALGVDEETARRIAADIAAVDLMLFMRYVSKLRYELELYAGDPLDVERGRRLYAETLTSRTGFVYDPRQWQFDRDPGLYSADYLRAWLAQSALEVKFREMFGERWWSEPEAGRWLREQWQRGSQPEAEEVVQAVGGKPWSGDALLSLYGERLAALTPS